MQDIENEDPLIERQIIKGVITDDDVCGELYRIYYPFYIKGPSLHKIMQWSMEYYAYYKKAPQRHIEDIFYDNIQNMDKGLVEKIETDILPELSGEYEQEGNSQFLLDRAKKYFNKRHAILFAERIQEIAENNDDFEEIEKEVKDFKPLEDNSLAGQLESNLLSSTDFLQQKIRKPKKYLMPWLREGSINMVFGPRGVGKTWLCMIISYILTREQPKNNELTVGPWEVKRPCSVVYLDGEMAEPDLQENMKGLAKSLPPEDPERPLHILSANRFAKQYEEQPNLASKKWRENIYNLLKKNPNIKVLVLDNAAALTPGIVENCKEEWDPINQWLISLRHLGVSTILVHHAGKGGEQRGTSGREDAMDTVIKVDYPSDYDPSKHHAYFKVQFTKSRNLKPGDDKKAFSLEIMMDDDLGLIWQETDAISPGEHKKRIMAEIVRGERKGNEIAKMFGVGSGRISQLRKEAKEKGFLDNNKQPTEAGLELVEKYAELETEPVG